MQPLPREFNPFALMLDPQAVLAQIEHSERLERLSRRVCRPLDKPMLGGAEQDGEGAEVGDVGDDALPDAQASALQPLQASTADATGG